MKRPAQACRIALLNGVLLTLAPLAAPAQIGDRQDGPGETQRPLVPAELIPPAPPLAPAAALAAFHLAPGLRIECVAHEPMVEDPVVAEFDPDGRLWVVEMRGYMPDLDGNGEDAPIGRVVVLQADKPGGPLDHRTVFADGLVLPRALAFARGGVLVGAPPHLWWLGDSTGAGRADTRREVAGDFGVPVDPKRPEMANPERAPNSLRWGLDNWLYCAAQLYRWRPRADGWERGLTSFRGQWGLTQDDSGRLFYNSNSDQLRYDAIPAEYLVRNPNAPHPGGNNVDAAENQLCWPGRVNPGVNRGYRPASLRDGRLKEFTAACAPWTLRSDLFPAEYYGNVLVAEPAGNLVRRNRLTEDHGRIRGTNAYPHAEFLTSTDERFRPVNFTTGPDGALYIVDMYRGVIQHRISLTSYLRRQSVDRGLVQPVHWGRIYRVAPTNAPATARAAHFSTETPAVWVTHLEERNAWWRETAQRLLVERRDPATVGPLRELARRGREPLGRVHALWTLEGMDAVTEADLPPALGDPDARVRAAGIRLAERGLAGPGGAALLDRLRPLPADPDPGVRLQLALSLGQAPAGTADELLAKLALGPDAPEFLPDAILSGLAGREAEFLARLLSNPATRTPAPGLARILRGLAGAILLQRGPEGVRELLEVAARTAPAARQKALLEGMAATRDSTAKKPVKLPSEPPGLAALTAASNAEIARLARQIAPLFNWPGQPGALVAPPIPPLGAADQAAFAEGQSLFRGACAACHQNHGRGLAGLAPPLVDSEWVLGPESRLIRLVLKGLHGPVSVGGKAYNLDMPAMGFFDDRQLAAILTYIRREWDHGAAPVTERSVAAERAARAGRAEAWSASELAP